MPVTGSAQNYEVTISYNQGIITGTSATGSITLETENKFCDDDITITYNRPNTGTGTSGTATPPSTISGNNATISYDDTDNTLTLEQTISVTPEVTAGYISAGTAGDSTVSLTTGMNINDSSDLSASGATVTAPAGYYPIQVSKSIASGSATTPSTTITVNPTISVDSTGLITASNSASQSITPTIVAGYISTGSSGTITVSGSSTNSLETQSAQTIHPSLNDDQIINGGLYLTGDQTIKGITTTNLIPGNIANGVTVKIGDSTDDDCVTTVTGTYTGSGGNVSSFSLTVTVDSGATVTATKGLETVTGISVNGECVLNLPSAGTWTVLAEKNNTSTGTKTITVTSSYEMTLSFVSNILNENSWDTIRAVSDAGNGDVYWNVGDCKEIILNGTLGTTTPYTFNNVTAYAFIIGFNHNATYEGNNRIHFEFAKTALSSGTDICFVDANGYGVNNASSNFHMNTSSINQGGWKSSYMRQTICGTDLTNYTGTFISVLPESLRNVLKTVTKYSNNSNNSSANTTADITDTTDVIFIPSFAEIFGGNISASGLNSYEKNYSLQYEYYANGNIPTKYKSNATSTKANWWLRSRVSSGTQNFFIVSTSSSSPYYDYKAATMGCGFAPCFCV